MSRSGKVFYKERYAGRIEETESGYSFTYDSNYLIDSNSKDISKTLPKRESPYTSNILFPFFDGLIPEGWLLDVVLENWKLNPRDRMGLLLVSCKDCIGAVSVTPE